jgi:hypothetical protein
MHVSFQKYQAIGKHYIYIYIAKKKRSELTTVYTCFLVLLAESCLFHIFKDSYVTLYFI